MYFLGIDIGTFSSKGVLVGEDGRVKARASVPHTMENPAPGYFEQDAEQIWWGDFCKLSKELIQTSDISPEEIGAVGASTLGADCFPWTRKESLSGRRFCMESMQDVQRKWKR